MSDSHLNKNKKRLKPVAIILAILLSSTLSAKASAEENTDSTNQIDTSSSKVTIQRDNEEQMRSFYEVLDDLLADFEFDIQNGNVKGLQDLSIRNIATSENVPTSFKNHLELLVTERILKHSKTRIIQCLPCRSSRATIEGNRVIIKSPNDNPQELTRLAQISGIEDFMDIAFTYQPSGMILSLFIVKPESSSVVWSRSYNSETSRAAAFRRGVDYSQIDEARDQVEYEPKIQYRLIPYYLYEKNLAGYVGTVGLGFRMVERYQNRNKEVGFELNYLFEANSLAGSNSPNSIYQFGGINLTLLFVHAFNFMGPLENYHQIRQSLCLGIGGTYAAGFLGGLFRANYEWRFGKHYAFAVNLGFRPPATAFIGGVAVGSVSGIEAGIGVSYLF